MGSCLVNTYRLKVYIWNGNPRWQKTRYWLRLMNGTSWHRDDFCLWGLGLISSSWLWNRRPRGHRGRLLLLLRKLLGRGKSVQQSGRFVTKELLNFLNKMRFYLWDGFQSILWWSSLAYWYCWTFFCWVLLLQRWRFYYFVRHNSWSSSTGWREYRQWFWLHSTTWLECCRSRHRSCNWSLNWNMGYLHSLRRRRFNGWLHSSCVPSGGWGRTVLCGCVRLGSRSACPWFYGYEFKNYENIICYY